MAKPVMTDHFPCFFPVFCATFIGKVIPEKGVTVSAHRVAFGRRTAF
jgi:hypothetical protein